MYHLRSSPIWYTELLHCEKQIKTTFIQGDCISFVWLRWLRLAIWCFRCLFQFSRFASITSTHANLPLCQSSLKTLCFYFISFFCHLHLLPFGLSSVLPIPAPVTIHIRRLDFYAGKRLCLYVYICRSV